MVMNSFSEKSGFGELKKIIGGGGGSRIHHHIDPHRIPLDNGRVATHLKRCCKVTVEPTPHVSRTLQATVSAHEEADLIQRDWRLENLDIMNVNLVTVVLAVFSRVRVYIEEGMFDTRCRCVRCVPYTHDPEDLLRGEIHKNHERSRLHLRLVFGAEEHPLTGHELSASVDVEVADGDWSIHVCHVVKVIVE